MTISRLLLLQAVLACGLSSVFFIPREERIQPSRVNMDLPVTLNDWTSHPAQVTQLERDALASDTQFSRRLYSDTFGNEVYVSIVLSGQDLDNSIHRPERCLPAQGWTVVDSRTVNIPMPGAPGGMLPVTRLHNMRQSKTREGNVFPIYNIDYYWFVGYSDITASHIQREFIDIKDRLLHGYNQHWAYITVSTVVTDGLPGVRDGRTEQQTDAVLQRLIQDMFPVIMKDAPLGLPGQAR